MYSISDTQLAILVMGSLLIIAMSLSITGQILRSKYNYLYTAITFTITAICSGLIAFPIALFVIYINMFRTYAGILAIISTAIMIYYLIRIWKSSENKSWFIFLIMYLLLLMHVTIFSRIGTYLPWIRLSLKDISELEFEDFRHFGLNMSLFIPIGLLTGLSNRKIAKVRYAVFGTMISLCIELTQVVFSIGECDIGDVIANTLGMAIGLYIVRYIPREYRGQNE